jgi:hypothetical protein
MDVPWFRLKKGNMYTIINDDLIKSGIFSGFYWSDQHSQWMLYFRDITGEYPNFYNTPELPYVYHLMTAKHSSTTS